MLFSCFGLVILNKNLMLTFEQKTLRTPGLNHTIVSLIVVLTKKNPHIIDMLSNCNSLVSWCGNVCTWGDIIKN